MAKKKPTADTIKNDLSRAIYKKDFKDLTAYEEENLRRTFFCKFMLGFEDFVELVGTEEGRNKLTRITSDAEKYSFNHSCYEMYRGICRENHMRPIKYQEYIGFIARILMDEDRLRKKFDIIKKRDGEDGRIFYILNKRKKDCILMALAFYPEIDIINVYLNQGDIPCKKKR